MMLHMTRDGGVEVVYTAPLVREDHKASLGQYASCTWPRCWPCRSMIGSPLVWFSAALRRGMRLWAKVTAAEEIQTDLEQKGLL